jgi:hypothetical protein
MGWQLAAAVLVVEIALVVQLVAGLVNMFTDGRAVDRLTFAGRCRW